MIKSETTKPSHSLTAAVIDDFSEKTFENLISMGADRREASRIRLCVEDVLYILMKELGENAPCFFCIQKRFGRETIKITVKGKRIVPSEMSESAEYGEFLYSSLLASSSLHFSCSYKDGENIILITPPKKKKLSQTMCIFIAVAAALFSGVLLMLLPNAVSKTVASVTEPLFDTMMNALKALSSPLMLLAVCCSIIGMGSICELGRNSKKIVFHMLKTAFVFSAISVIPFVFLFPLKLSGGVGSLALSGLYKMLLDIIPPDIFSPFISGNALQIIFIGVILSIAILIAGERAAGVREGLNQTNTLVEIVSELLMKAMPVFVFLSILSFFTSDLLNNFKKISKAVLLIAVCCLILTVTYTVFTAIKTKQSPFSIIKILLPSFLIALTTASSSAAYSPMIKNCNEEFSILPKITQFAIPLGRVIFMPGGAVEFFVLSLCLAELYGVEISIIWLITAFFVSFALSVSFPPIPGGSLACITVLFTQLGIPTEGVAIAAAVDIITDYIVTATDVATLQLELVLSSNKK